MYDFSFFAEGGYCFGYQTGRCAYYEKKSSLWWKRNVCDPLRNGLQAQMYEVCERIHGCPKQDREEYPNRKTR